MNTLHFIARTLSRLVTLTLDPACAIDHTVFAEKAIGNDELSRVGWIAEAWAHREALAPYIAAERLAWWNAHKIGYLAKDSHFKIHAAKIEAPSPVQVEPLPFVKSHRAVPR